MENKFIGLRTKNDYNDIYVNVNHIILFGSLIDEDNGDEIGSYLNILEFKRPINVCETPEQIFDLL